MRLERVDQSKTDKTEFLPATTLERVEAGLIEVRGQPGQICVDCELIYFQKGF
jgi:hypothetical protein